MQKTKLILFFVIVYCCIGITDGIYGNRVEAINVKIANSEASKFEASQIDPNTAIKLQAEARTLELTAGELWNQKQFEESIVTLERGLEIWQKLGNRNKEGHTLNLLGSFYHTIGLRKKALFFYEQALAIYQEVNDPEEKAFTLENIASIYEENKRYQDAINYYQQSLEIVKQLKDKCGQARILQQIGGFYSTLSHPYHKEPIADLDTLTNRRSLIQIRQLALDYYYQALPIARVLNCKNLGATLNGIGVIYEHLGQDKEALKFYQQALKENQKQGELHTIIIFSNLASLKIHQGQLEAALTDIKTAINIIEKARTSLINPEFRSAYFSSFASIYKKYIEILMQLHQKNPSQGYDAQALHASERARARGLLELLTEANTDIRSGVEPQLLAAEDKIQQQINDLENRKYQLLNGQYSQRQIKEIQENINALLNQLEQVAAQIRLKSPGYGELKYPQPLTLQQIQKQVLDENTILLEYFLGDDDSYLWLVSKDSLTSYKLPKGNDIEAVAKEFYSSLKEKKAGAAEAGKKLSQILLQPVAKKLANKRLLIVADGALQYIPFAALPVEGRVDYTPMLVENEIVTLPSASTVDILRRQLKGRPPAPKKLAVIADPIFELNDTRFSGVPQPNNSQKIASNKTRAFEFGETFSRLEYTRTEAEQILALVPESQRFQALDFQASREIATSKELENYQIIHFATHGKLDAVQPKLSSLVFSLFDENGKSQNGFLRLQDIFNLKLPAELVVLSACETGLGEEVKGEGLVGLTRGFMYAGAKRVVVSLWSVSDVGTAELMAKFYQKMLKEGLNPTIALREAQLEMWKTDNFSAPYYWAAFSIQGDWR